MIGVKILTIFNPIGRTFAAASTLFCTRSQALGGSTPGVVASEEALRNVVLAGSFKHFRRATETPFNRIFEDRIETV